MKSTESSVALGRPRAFCVERTLDRALRVFWQKGYEGTSLSDLTDAMGINRPSLYVAYDNEEALFHKALDRYVENSATFLRQSIEQTTARAVVEHLLFAAVDGMTCPENPHGCLTVRCALSNSETEDSIRLELANRRANGESMMR